jgi:DNA-binding protein YbaB
VKIVSEDLTAGISRLDDMLSEARRELMSTRAAPAEEAGEEAEPVQGLGEAAEGQVKVTVVSGGKVEKIVVNPGLLRQGLEAICEHIAKATNAALDDLRAKVSAASAAAVDPAALSAQLKDLQDQSMQQMNQISDALSLVVARMRGQ